jgi:hypothetical protein
VSSENSGSDVAGCGSAISNPCSTVSFAVNYAIPGNTDVIEVVTLDGVHIVCNVALPLAVDVKIRANRWNSTLVCSDPTALTMFVSRPTQNLTLENLELLAKRSIISMESNGVFSTNNCSVRNEFDPLIILPFNDQVQTISFAYSSFRNFSSFFDIQNAFSTENELVSAEYCSFEAFSKVAFVLKRNQTAKFSNCVFRDSIYAVFSFTKVKSVNFLKCKFLNLVEGSWEVFKGSIVAEECVFSGALNPQIYVTAKTSESVLVVIRFSEFSHNSGSGLFYSTTPNENHKFLVQDTLFFNNIINNYNAFNSIVFANGIGWSEFIGCIFRENGISALFKFTSLTFPFHFKFFNCSVYGSQFGSLTSNIHINSSVILENNTFSDTLISTAEGILSFAGLTLQISVSRSIFVNIAAASFPTVSISACSLVVFDGCSFRNISGSNLPGIYIASSKLLFLRSSMISMKTLQASAGIYSVDSVIDIQSSEFISVMGRAGAVLCATISASKVNISNSLILNCTSLQQFGLFFGNVHSSLNFDSVVIRNANSFAGAILLRVAFSTLSMKNIVIENSFGPGAFFSLSSSTVVFENISILRSGNSRNAFIAFAEGSLDIRRFVFQNNSFFNGIWLQSNGIVNIQDSTFIGNNIYGDVDASLICVSSVMSFSLTNTTFVSNFAPFGGAMFVQLAGFFWISGSTFVNNSAYQGGVFFVNSSEPQVLVIEDSTFLRNRAILPPIRFIDCRDSYGSGGVFYYRTFFVSSFYESVRNCVFEENLASFFGGVLAIGQSVTDLSFDSFGLFTLKSSLGNKALKYGDVIGSLWRTVEGGLASKSILLSDTFGIQVRYFDRFGQFAYGFRCSAQIQISSSSPDDSFQLASKYVDGGVFFVNSSEPQVLVIEDSTFLRNRAIRT